MECKTPYRITIYRSILNHEPKAPRRLADTRGVQAELALGADAAQLGTAFLVCREFGAATVPMQQPTESFRLDYPTVLG